MESLFLVWPQYLVFIPLFQKLLHLNVFGYFEETLERSKV